MGFCDQSHLVLPNVLALCRRVLSYLFADIQRSAIQILKPLLEEAFFACSPTREVVQYFCLLFHLCHSLCVLMI